MSVTLLQRSERVLMMEMSGSMFLKSLWLMFPALSWGLQDWLVRLMFEARLSFMLPSQQDGTLTLCLRAWFLLLKNKISFFLMTWFLKEWKNCSVKHIKFLLRNIIAALSRIIRSCVMTLRMMPCRKLLFPLRTVPQYEFVSEHV